jgi:pimeloyl-ACP methyl ester carboxylesterase
VFGQNVASTVRPGVSSSRFHLFGTPLLYYCATMKHMLLLAVLVACGSSAPATKSTPATDAVIEGKVKAADGVDIVYDVRGRGEPAIVFVHCWSCDRTFWKNQVDVFAKTHRVVTVDLGGHGQSGTNRTTWTVASLAGDVQSVMDALKLTRVILVGHSMGGPVSLEVARKLPGRVAGIACVDTLHDAEMKMPEGMRDQLVKRFETDFAGTMSEGMKMMIHEKTDPAVRDFISAKSMAANKDVMVPLMREMMGMELAPMLSAAKVPIRCINAVPYGPIAPTTNVATNKKYADYDAVTIDGSGHYVQLEKPDELNAKLEVIVQAIK